MNTFPPGAARQFAAARETCLYRPAFQVLTPEHMIKDGLSAPLHDGAVRYYREKGWLK